MAYPYYPNMRMKHLLLTLLGLTSFISVNAQALVERSNEWKTVFENTQIQILAKYGNCEIIEEGFFAEYIYLKAVNKTDRPVELSWYNDVYFENIGCTTCNRVNSEPKNSITLEANGSKQGECALGYNNGLKVFTKSLRSTNNRTFNKLELSEITTNILN